MIEWSSASKLTTASSEWLKNPKQKKFDEHKNKTNSEDVQLNQQDNNQKWNRYKKKSCVVVSTILY